MLVFWGQSVKISQQRTLSPSSRNGSNALAGSSSGPLVGPEFLEAECWRRGVKGLNPCSATRPANPPSPRPAAPAWGRSAHPDAEARTPCGKGRVGSAPQPGQAAQQLPLARKAAAMASASDAFSTAQDRLRCAT